MSHEPPNIEEIRTALGPEAKRVEITPPTGWRRDAVRIVVPEPALVTTWTATGAAVARRLRAAGYRVEHEGDMGVRMWVRAPLQPGELGLRQVVTKGYRSRRFRVPGEWDLIDHNARVVGSAWRVGERRDQDKVYRVRLAGLPENPRTYRSLAAAIAAAERALAVQQNQ